MDRLKKQNVSPQYTGIITVTDIGNSLKQSVKKLSESSFLTYRSTSQMRIGEEFSQQAVPVAKELYTEQNRRKTKKEHVSRNVFKCTI